MRTKTARPARTCPDWCTGRHPRRGPHRSEAWLHPLALEPRTGEHDDETDVCWLQLSADPGVIGGATPTIRLWTTSAGTGFTMTVDEAREVAISLLRLAACADDGKARPTDVLSHWGIRGEAVTV